MVASSDTWRSPAPGSSISRVQASARGCQTRSVPRPAGSPRSSKRPSAPVMTANGVSSTTTNAAISRWTLQKTRTSPGRVNRIALPGPGPTRPKSKRLLGETEKTLCRIGSWFGNRTSPPTGTTTTRGWKRRLCVSISTAAAEGGAPAPPAGVYVTTAWEASAVGWPRSRISTRPLRVSAAPRAGPVPGPASSQAITAGSSSRRSREDIRPSVPYRKSCTRRALDPILEQAACDHQALDLRGALVDLHHPRVAVVALDRILLHVAVAAVHLDRLMRHPGRRLAAVELGHRRLARERLARVLEPGGALDQEPRALDAALHLGQLELDRLNLGQRLSERLALLRVLHGFREGGGHHPQRLGRHADPPHVEGAERDPEPVPLGAEPVLDRHLQVVERERHGVRAAQPHLVLGPADDQARRATPDDERRDP